jgi:polyketide synthase PksN
VNPSSLPLALESLCILEACAQEMFVWVRRSGGAQQLDIDVCDLQGNVCVQMRGVTYEQETAALPDSQAIALRESQSPAPAQRALAKPSGISLTAVE